MGQNGHCMTQHPWHISWVTRLNSHLHPCCVTVNKMHPHGDGIHPHERSCSLKHAAGLAHSSLAICSVHTTNSALAIVKRISFVTESALMITNTSIMRHTLYSLFVY